MANYGDVALHLPPTWDRAMFAGDDLQLGTVGHVSGVADAHLKDDPESQHQFYWANLSDMMGMNKAQQRGYKLVQAETWVKNPGLWEWDASGHLINGFGDGGLRLMARPAALYFADMKRRKATKETVSREFDRAIDGDAPEGTQPLDSESRVVERKRATRAARA